MGLTALRPMEWSRSAHCSQGRLESSYSMSTCVGDRRRRRGGSRRARDGRRARPLRRTGAAIPAARSRRGNSGWRHPRLRSLRSTTLLFAATRTSISGWRCWNPPRRGMIHKPGDADGRGDRHRLAVAPGGERVDAILKLLKGAVGDPKETFAFRGEADRAIAAVEQSNVERVLERDDLAADGGLGEEKILRGERNAHAPPHGDETANEIERRQPNGKASHVPASCDRTSPSSAVRCPVKLNRVGTGPAVRAAPPIAFLVRMRSMPRCRLTGDRRRPYQCARQSPSGGFHAHRIAAFRVRSVAAAVSPIGEANCNHGAGGRGNGTSWRACRTASCTTSASPPPSAGRKSTSRAGAGNNRRRVASLGLAKAASRTSDRRTGCR